MSTQLPRRTPRERGFTLIELLIVAGIISILAAVALPAIGRYVRNYRITGAMQQLSGELQAARAQAIRRNVNFGVVFQAWSPTQYQWIMEDTPGVFTRGPLSPLPPTRVFGNLSTLPQGVQFDNNPPPTATQGPANACRVRFNRLGGACQPDGSNLCPNTTPVACPAPLLFAGPANAFFTVTLFDTRTQVRRTVTISSGGRIRMDNQ